MIALVTGGAASGKSEYAESLLLAAPHHPRIYLAAMISRGPEDAARVARHRSLRAGKGFATVERPLDLAGWECPAGAAVLLECVTTLLANEMYEPGGSGGDAARKILTGLRRLAARAGTLVAVTGEIFSDGRNYDAGTMEYITLLGYINREMASMANRVTEVVCGIPLSLKEDRDEG